MGEIKSSYKRPSKYSQFSEEKKIASRLCNKKWREKHRTHVQNYMRKYKQSEKWLTYRKQYNKLWWQENSEKDKIRHRKWYEGIKCSWNAERRITFRKSREMLFHVLGQHTCVKCGFYDKRALQFDHINGGGTKEHKTTFLNRRIMFYVYYVLHPELAQRTLQVLCANCNMIKRMEKREDTII